MKLVKHETYPGMWRIQYSKKRLSENFWNLSRANDVINHHSWYVWQEKRRININPDE